MLMHAAVNNLNWVPTPTSAPASVFALQASLVAWGTVALLWIGAVYLLISMRKTTGTERVA
jgi:hypothetical protein